jgi:ankyrin repeat protein
VRDTPQGFTRNLTPDELESTRRQEVRPNEQVIRGSDAAEPHLRDQQLVLQRPGIATVSLGHGRSRPAGPITQGDQLGKAAQRNDIVKVKRLLKRGVDVNTKNAGSGVTPLGVACERGHMEVVQALIEAHAFLDEPTNDGLTALHIASQFGQAEVVRALCAAGSLVNLRCFRHAASPLMYAGQVRLRACSSHALRCHFNPELTRAPARAARVHGGDAGAGGGARRARPGDAARLDDGAAPGERPGDG